MSKFTKQDKPIIVIALALFLSLYSVITPALFAQNSSDVENSAKSRQYLELINSVFTFVQQNYVDEVDPKIIYEGAMKGIMDSLGDTYTSYLNEKQMRAMSDTTVGNFGGVGLSISKPAESTPEKPAYVEVASPIEDTPGWKAGIQSGDLLLEINGVKTPDITMDEVLGILRGKIGESVNLLIRRGKTMEFPVTLVRALIEVPTVKFGMIKENGNNIGYLRIIEFTPQTPERVQQALDSFKEDDFSGLIIDLRNNPGGLITSVVDVADKFIDSGPIVSTKSRHSYENSVYTASSRRTTMPKNIPIVVLINKGSASASEILSGALKDNHLAYLVGERTYGKGSVQQVVPLPNSDGIKLTMARYYTPSDSNIDKIGIPPDLIVKMPELSEEEEKIYIELITSTEIADYVESHPNMTEAHITAYAKQLGYKYKMNQLYLRRLVKLEVYRTRTQPLYDLDFDIQLNEAINVVKSSNFKNLLKMTKTLKELQEIAAKEVEIADKK
ncbi:MAG: S41 family peptidase [Treponema sp.]|nr:S41 family peptidase [Treponema sp.]